LLMFLVLAFRAQISFERKISSTTNPFGRRL
jgi:hypothetical protein